ncbi:hypothetical protein BKM63_02960 [Flavobacterium johnsoniae]|uniref:Uncharacterized protein n=1 Tax=Flavobacterium johnsoniae TaxID=986 RepID=A0A1J7BX09_FLAJO|nr:hypothetical protein BKM63_02960 [Flavobacterium johnsoniae]
MVNQSWSINQDCLEYNQILYGWDFRFNIPIHCGLLSSALFLDFRFPTDLKAKEDWLMWLFFFKKMFMQFLLMKY